MLIYVVWLDILCECGMHHTGNKKFESTTALVRWLMDESTNIDKVHSVIEVVSRAK